MMNSTILKKTIINKILVVIFWIMIWWGLAIVVNKELLLPTPLATFKALIELFKTDNFWISIFYTILRVCTGVVLASFFGITIGIICGLNKYAYVLLNPAILVIKSTPVMSFIIITIIWMKSSYVPVFICFLLCFPIIWMQTVTGIKNVDNKLIEMSKVYKVKMIYIIKNIYINSIKPYVIAAIITSIGLGWKVTVTAEVLSSIVNSVGSNMYDAKIYLETSKLFAWTIVVIVLSMMIEYGFKCFIKNYSEKVQHDRN